MQTFRLFWIDDAGVVIAQSEPFQAADDAAAWRDGEALADRDHAELWQGMRLVARINPKPMPRLARSSIPPMDLPAR